MFNKKAVYESKKINTPEFLKLTSDQRSAIETLGLSFPISANSAKMRYKALVKLYHPDANKNLEPGVIASDEKIKAINQAYKVVIDFLASP